MAFLTGAISGAATGAIKQKEEAREREKEVLKDREEAFNDYIKEYQKRVTEEDKTINGHVDNMNRLTAEYMSLGLTPEEAKAAAFGNYKTNPNKQYVDTEVSSIQKLREDGVATPSYIRESLQLSAPDPSKPKVTAQQLARQLTPETRFDMPYFARRQDTVPGLQRFFGRAEEGEESSRLTAQRASFDRQMQSLMARRPEREDVELTSTVGGRLPARQKILTIPQQIEKLELQIKNSSTPAEIEALRKEQEAVIARRDMLKGTDDDDGRPATENTFANALRGQSVSDFFAGDNALLQAHKSQDDSVKNKAMMVKSYAFRNYAAARLAERGKEYKDKLMRNMQGGLTTSTYGSLLGRDFFDRLEEDYAIRLGGVYTLDEYVDKLHQDRKSKDPVKFLPANKVYEGKDLKQIQRIMEAFYIPKDGEGNTYTNIQIKEFKDVLKRKKQ